MRTAKKTIRFKVYNLFIISIIIPSIITAILFWMFYSRTTLAQEEKNQDNILKSIASNIETQFMELKNIGDTCYMQQVIFRELEALNNPKLYEHDDAVSRNRQERECSEALTKILYMAEQEICDIVFFPMNVEEQKAYYMDKNQSGLQEIIIEGYEKEDWFIRAAAAQGRMVLHSRHVPEYRKGQKREEVYSCVMAIQDLNNDKIIGVIKIDSDIKNLEKIVDIIEGGENDNIIISEENKILTSSKDIKNLNIKELKDGVRYIDNKLYTVQSMEIQNSGWELIYLFSLQKNIRAYLCVLFTTCLVTGATVLGAFFIYKRYSGKMLDDVEHFTNIFREIQTGNLEVKAEVKSENELSDIAEAVNQMTHNLKEYIEKEYVWVIEQQEAKFKALQAQINPHFLYNTLNGLIALNRMGEKQKLEKNIINLTHLFRYACSNENVTTIEKECSFLEEYLELEKLKYEERLEYMIFVDDACKERMIPKLLLQPIVENSVIHGMGDTDRAIMIKIMVTSREVKGIGNATVITVRDNGSGFDCEADPDGKEHVGMENVRKRAELFCEEVIYQCTSKPGKGTKTTLAFKHEEKREIR